MLKYDLARLNKRVTFGNHVNSDEVNPNTDEPIVKFEALQTVWCGDYSMTANQTISLAGLSNTGVRMIVIRHNPNIANATVAQLEGIEYEITSINSDDNINAFDLVTLTDVSKHD